MRTTYRVVSATIALAAVFPLGMPAAHAESVQAQPADVAAWFWEKQVSGTMPVGGAPYPAGVPAPLSGVDADRYAVAYQGGTETLADGSTAAKAEKETYLSWDIYANVEPGDTIDSFVVTLPLDPAGESNNFVPPSGQPQLVACRPVGGFGSANGDSFAARPTDDCTDLVFSSFDATAKAYTFDITTYAQDWIEGDNFGIAIRPRIDETAPFQLQFLSQDKLTANWSYTKAPAEEEPFEEEPFVPVDVPVDEGFTGGVDLGDTVVPQPQPAPQAPPVVAMPDAPRPIRRAAAVPFVQDTEPTWQFWAAALTGVVLLGVVSLILGDDRLPVTETAGSSRLDRVLRNRQASLGTQGPATQRHRVRTV